MTNNICKHCGKEFINKYKDKSDYYTPKFCCTQCYNESRSYKDKVCPYCLKTFANKNKKFCSVKCSTGYNNPKMIHTEEFLINLKKRNKASIGENNPFYGLKHKDKTKIQIGQKNKGRFKGKKYEEIMGEKKAKQLKKDRSIHFQKVFQERIKTNNFYTKFKYNKINMRSSWEVKVAKWLDENNIKWEYESNNCKFLLSNSKYYIIDFYLPDLNKYIEVKGWWDDYSKQKYLEARQKLNVCIIDKRNIDNINLNMVKI